jgi:DegV family protein with EDD domain
MTFEKIRFVTDSTCDIPSELAQQHGIGIVPCFINHGDKSYIDLGMEVAREEFYRDLPSMRPAPTTAAPSPGMTREVIDRTFEGADHLVIVSVASKLSGTYNAMRLGAAHLPQDRVTLIDSQSTTFGLGWQVLIGAETAERTGSVEETVAAIERVRKVAHVFAVLETMEYLRRSGRVGWATASLGALLQIKPILSVYDGEVPAVARVRTFSRAIDELVRLARDQAPLDRLAVLHAADPDGAVNLRERVAEFAPSDTIIVSITPTIGTHIGPGGLGLATVSQSWRN